MGTTKKPRKKYVPPADRLASLVKSQERKHFIRQFAELNEPCTPKRIDAALKPLEHAIDEIVRTGEGNIGPGGQHIFEDVYTGEWFPLATSLYGACNVFNQIGTEEDVAPLRRLGKRLELGMLLFQEDVDAARKVFAWMRAVMATKTPNEMGELYENLGQQADPGSRPA